MTRTAKLFINGRSQAVRLPADFRFEGTEVFIRRDTATGDVVLSSRPHDWDGFLVAVEGIDIDERFLSKEDRPRTQSRDPFATWPE